jgi:methyltransferase-like protein/SAM-dependent methyltransferase
MSWRRGATGSCRPATSPNQHASAPNPQEPATLDHYEDVPYQSIPFPDTHPAHLAVIGRLFGLSPADPARARVLELGCAAGGNLIPLAWYQRGGRYLGIDLAPNQVADGQALIDRLGLTNCALRAGDILDLNAHLGEFDYIVAHGVYSWVPEPVRRHLLRLCRDLLALHGIAYISYNTLPGWRMRGMLRDLLQYAARGAETAEAKLAAAHAAMARMAAAVDGLDALSARYLKTELASLKGTHPSYLLHEYMAAENTAFLLRDFIADAADQGLTYIADTELQTLFPAVLGEGVERALGGIEDQIEIEQWHDFVANRNFRRSLLCRDDAPMVERIDFDAFEAMAFSADLTPPNKLDLRRAKPANFHQTNGATLNVSHPLTKAALVHLAGVHPDALTLADLYHVAARMVSQGGGGAQAQETAAFSSELFSLFAHRAVRAHPSPLAYHRAVGDRPATSRLARAQAAAGWSHVTGVHHTGLDLDPISTRLVGLLDGTRDLDALTREIADELAGGTLPPPPGLDPQRLSREHLAQQVRAACGRLLGLFARHGVLISGQPIARGPQA